MYLDIVIKLIVLFGISYIAYRNNFLDESALSISFAIGFIVLFLGGWSYFFLLLLFLLVGSLMTKLINNPGAALRSWPNVIANGFWPAISVVYMYISPDKITPTIFYLGSLNAMFSDTVSTEVGMYFGGKPRLIINPSKMVKKGLSGGVTIDGILGGFLASYIFAYISSILMSNSWNSVFIHSIWLSGFLSSISDSILGSTLQAKYTCVKCGDMVESDIHCGVETIKISGYKWINNHSVNFISSLLGGLLAVFFFKTINMI